MPVLSIPASVITELAKTEQKYCLALLIPGAPSAYGLTDNPRPITINSQVYTPDDGMIMGAGSVSRKQQISADSYEIQVDATQLGIYQDYVTNVHVGKPVELHVAWVDDEYNIINGDAVLTLYGGLMDSWTLSESTNGATLSFRVTSHWGSFKIKKGRYTNTASQEEAYPGDKIFEHSFQEELPLRWGI